MRAKLNPETRKQKGWREARPSFSVSTPREEIANARSTTLSDTSLEMSLSSRVPVGRSLAASRRPAPRASVRCVADAATAVSTETLKRKILRLSALTDRGQLLFQQKACVLVLLPLRLSLVILRAHRADVPDRQSLVHVLRASTGTPRWTTTAGNTARRSPRRSRPWSRPRAGTSPTSLPADPSRTRAS